MQLKINTIFQAVILILLTSFSNANAKNLNKIELFNDIGDHYITISFDKKTYCIEATDNELIPVDNIQGCNSMTDIMITNKGTVCIEDGDMNCNKIHRESLGLFWGNENQVNLYQLIGELKRGVNSSSENKKDVGESYMKKARKYFKQKKYFEAYEYAKKAANLGHKDGYFGIGMAFEKGYGVEEKNKKEAIFWYKKAAEKGHIKGQLKVAQLIRFDDPDEAVFWLKKAAKAGNKTAMNNIGYMWAKGHLSTFGNNTEAFKWYMKSAKLGDKSGQYNVCLSLYYGKGVSKNRKEAQKWCQRAVDQGYKKAESLLEKTKEW